MTKKKNWQKADEEFKKLIKLDSKNNVAMLYFRMRDGSEKEAREAEKELISYFE